MIRVAIIGAGIGAQHLAAYRELPDRFVVKTLCDLDIERAEGLVVGDAQTAVSDDFKAVLADPDIDLVDICLPPHLHLQACLDALAAGKHVICEKPLVRSPAEAQTLGAALNATDRRLFPMFQYRYGTEANKLHALIKAGLVGKPLVATVETHWNRLPDYYDVDWRGTWAGESGGAVLGHAIHNHDFVALFMGGIRRVFAMLDTRVNEIEVEDCAALCFTTQSGALVTSSVTLGAAQEITRLRLCYSDLTAESDLAPYAPATGTWRYIARDPGKQAQVDTVLASVPSSQKGFAGFFEAAADALEGAPGREVSFEDGRQSIELVAAIYQSARTGLPVDLPLNDSLPVFSNWAPEKAQSLGT